MPLLSEVLLLPSVPSADNSACLDDTSLDAACLDTACLDATCLDASQ